MSYELLSDDLFDELLVDVIDRYNSKASCLLQVPGIYEVLSEYYNNQVLDLYEELEQVKKGINIHNLN